MSDEPKLTLEAEKAIRNYLINLFAIPTVIVTVLSFVIGYLINTGAAGKAERDATIKFNMTIDNMRDTVDQFRKDTFAKRIEAQTALIQISNLTEQAKNLQTKVETLSALKGAEDLVNSLTTALSSDPGFQKTIVDTLSTTRSEHAATLTDECPDSVALRKIGFCIWNEPGLDKTYIEAASACKSKRARLCSMAEVSAAQAAGAEWCNWGWSADRAPNDPNKAVASFPMQKKASGCGDKLFNYAFMPLDTKYGANCCK